MRTSDEADVWQADAQPAAGNDRKSTGGGRLHEVESSSMAKWHAGSLVQRYVDGGSARLPARGGAHGLCADPFDRRARSGDRGGHYHQARPRFLAHAMAAAERMG